MNDVLITWPEAVTRALDRAVADGGTVLLLGATDSGKSTLTRELVNRAVAAGRRVAVVDADVGQSDIGPPTTIGLGFPTAPVASLGEIAAEQLYFVGDTSPARHLLPMAVGTALLTRAACAAQCDLILIDTTGMVSGRQAETLKFHKIQATRPRCILAVQRHDELEHLLLPFRGRGSPRVIRLPVAPQVRVKSPTERQERRQAAFARALADAREVSLECPAVALWAPALPARLCGRVCGLLDRRGDTLAFGILEEVFATRLALFTPVDAAAAVTTVQVGSVIINRQGEERGRR